MSLTKRLAVRRWLAAVATASVLSVLLVSSPAEATSGGRGGTVPNRLPRLEDDDVVDEAKLAAGAFLSATGQDLDALRSDLRGVSRGG